MKHISIFLMFTASVVVADLIFPPPVARVDIVILATVAGVAMFDYLYDEF